MLRPAEETSVYCTAGPTRQMHTALLTSLTQVRTDCCINTGEKKNGGIFLEKKKREEESCQHCSFCFIFKSCSNEWDVRVQTILPTRHALHYGRLPCSCTSRRKEEKGRERKTTQKKDAQEARGEMRNDDCCGWYSFLHGPSRHRRLCLDLRRQARSSSALSQQQSR